MPRSSDTLRFERYVPIAPRRAWLASHARRLVQVTVPGLFLSLAACGGNVEPNIQLNPDPSMRYEVVFHIDNPNFIFESTEVTALYEVTNELCAPRVPISGVRKAPRMHVPLQLRQVDPRTYATSVVGDLLHDEDYFGLGVCHWSLTSVNMIVRRGQSALSAGIVGRDIFSGAESTDYYPKAWDTYGHAGFAEVGSSDIRSYRDPTSTFAISVRAKEISR